MEGSNNSLTIREFAFKKQAPVDGLVNGVLNGVITYFLLAGLTDIPVISHPGSVFSKSLLGTLVMPAIIIAFAISLLTSRTAVKKRIKGEVTPSLDAGEPWLKSTRAKLEVQYSVPPRGVFHKSISQRRIGR